MMNIRKSRWTHTLFQKLYSKEIVPFIDSIVEFQESKNSWSFIMEEPYADYFLFSERGIKVNRQLCLCTIIDMGQAGQFSNACLKGIKEFCKAHYYQPLNNIYGLLIARGIENDGYHRYMELRVPIKEL